MKEFRISYFLNKYEIIEIVIDFLSKNRNDYFIKLDITEDNEISLIYNLKWNGKTPFKKALNEHIKDVLSCQLLDDLSEDTTETQAINGLAVYLVEKLELYK